MTGSIQELDEIFNDDYFDVKIAKQAIIDWRDKQVEEVTRFEVIDDTGRAYTSRGVSVKLSYQDDGRTLKVFVNKLNDGKNE